MHDLFVYSERVSDEVRDVDVSSFMALDASPAGIVSVGKHYVQLNFPFTNF